MLTPEELRAVATAVQWAGHFAGLCGCEAGGPAFTAIADATRIIEGEGAHICHSRATRHAIGLSEQISRVRRAA